MPQRPPPKAKPPPRRAGEFPPQTSSGYLVRDAHRAFQRLLERRIAAYGVTRGQWYFLRVLWITDGLSQRELSARVGMMEPTTVIALRSMEKSGLIRRVRPHRQGKAAARRIVGRCADHHRRSGGGHRAARSRRVPAHRCADDGKSRSD
jgi:hypothetical protein